MIFLGLGANMPSQVGAPPASFAAVGACLEAHNITVVARSRLYTSLPIYHKRGMVLPSKGARFYNAVWQLRTMRSPRAVLACLHAIEKAFGRVRPRKARAAWAARPLDLDLLDWHRRIQDHGPILPHPRLHQRGFVLRPLSEIAPSWRHPILLWRAAELYARLPALARAQPVIEARA